MTSGRPSRAWIVGVVGGLAAIAVIVTGVVGVLSPAALCAGVGDSEAVTSCRVSWVVAVVLAAIALVVFLGIALAAGLRSGGWMVRLPLLAWPGLFLAVGVVMLLWGIDPPRVGGSAAGSAGGGPSIGMLIGGLAIIVLGLAPLPFARRITRLLDGDGR
ncbi:MAG: hypothetical protein WEG56_02990 [Chloroflexota bacterium]